MNFKHLIPLLALPAAACTTETAKMHPNVVFILADDLGCSELGCYGNTFNETPNIDRLAAEGIRFTNAYAAQTVSSPTRAALMTGLYPQRTGIVDYLRPNDATHLSESYFTLPEMLSANGYRTCIIGKWHQTGYTAAGAPYQSGPDKHGFADVRMTEKVGIADGTYFHPYHFNTDIEKRFDVPHEFLVDHMNAEALDFIGQQSKERPFFLYLSHYAVHTNLHGKPEDVDHFRAKPGAGQCPPSNDNPANDPYLQWPADFMATHNNPHLAAMLLTVDRGVGEIVEKLKQMGLYENTIIVFTSDNGGETRITSNAPCREGKSTLYEGGIRIPMIVSAPKLLAKGREVVSPTVTFDYYPTFCQMLGVKTDTVRHDGVSIWPLLLGKATTLAPRTLYWHYPLDKPHFLGGRSSGAVHDGDWKLIEFFDTGEKELYNLKDDPSETTNLAAEHPDRVERLYEMMLSWRKDVGAQIKPLQTHLNL